MIDDNTLCRFEVEPSGLKFRNEIMLERDRGQVSLAAHTLAGTSDRGEERTTPPVSFGALKAAMASESQSIRRGAALLLGRCVVEGQAEALDALVDASLATETDALVRAELAMSTVLRANHRDSGLVVLKSVVDTGPSSAACTAAAYLAQTGDASGWKQVVAALDSAQDTTLRAEATRALVAFGPMQGLPAGTDGLSVDTHALLKVALADPEITVRQTAVAAVFELRLPDGVALLEGIAANDPAPGVRAVASHWLWHLRRALR